MGVTIKCPVKRFAGTVTLCKPLTFPQYLAWEDAVNEANKLEGVSKAFALVGGICECVEKWDLKGFPEVVTKESFPSTPMVAVSKLLNWLINEMNTIIVETEDEDPNE